jgi:hypothetical protein
MHNDMSKETKDQVLARLRQRYVSAGPKHKRKLITQAVELLGYHRKAAIRALRGRPRSPVAPAVLTGRPREYHPDTLRPILKPIWFAAFQPCGSRLRALLPEWLPAYEQDHRRLDADVRKSLLTVSARTLDRLLAPLRVQRRRRGGTRPGSLLRQSIPIRGEGTEQGPGWLELDTIALCGGALDDRHLWMLDGVDIRTDWTEQRALENRGQHCTLAQLRDLEASLPLALLGMDSDNGGEFINHHVAAWLQQRPQPVLFTRARPYRKNDNAHVEQRNWTHVRQHFGYERYDNPAVAPQINLLCKGPLGQLQNHFLPTHKLESKRREGTRTVRVYGAAQTPYARVLAAQPVSAAKKTELQTLHDRLNPFQLGREIERQKQQIEALADAVPSPAVEAARWSVSAAALGDRLKAGLRAFGVPALAGPGRTSIRVAASPRARRCAPASKRRGRVHAPPSARLTAGRGDDHARPDCPGD